MEVLLHMFGVRVFGHLSAYDSPFAWRQAIARLVAFQSIAVSALSPLASIQDAGWRRAEEMSRPAEGSERSVGDGAQHPMRRRRLSKTLVVDMDNWALIHEPSGAMTKLTAREMRVLELLLRRPYRFISVSELVHHLEQGASGVLERHRVVQTVSGLRLKLNAHGGNAHVLISRRGLGYLLISEEAASASRRDPRA